MTSTGPASEIAHGVQAWHVVQVLSRCRGPYRSAPHYLPKIKGLKRPQHFDGINDASTSDIPRFVRSHFVLICRSLSIDNLG